MSKHSLLNPKMIDLFDFAAANPMQGPMMTAQMTMPAVFLQMMEQHEQDMHRLDQMLAGDAEKAVQEQHEERTSSNIENAQEGEGLEQETESTHFSLIYYNPDTGEAQVIKEEVQAKIADYAVKEKKHKAGAAGAASTFRASDYLREQQAQSQASAKSPGKAKASSMSSPHAQFEINSPAYLAAKTARSIDQAVGQKSTFPIYTNVAAPIVTQPVDPIRLEMALKKIEVQSPKPFGGAAGVSVAPQVFDKVEERVKNEGIQAEIVAVDTLKTAEIKPEAEPPEIVALERLREVEGMRAETLHQLDLQIKAFEHVIEELEVTDKPMEKVLGLLPPLSKSRYLALLEHDRKIAETLVVDLLIADLEFMVIVKEAITKKGLRGLIDTLKKLGRIPSPIIQKSGGGGDDDEDEDVEVIPIKKSAAEPEGSGFRPRKSGKKGGKGKKGSGGKAGSARAKPKKKKGLLGRALSKLTKRKKKGKKE